MSADQNNLQAPVPRDREGPTESELIPFKSTKINIWKSKALVPLMLAGLMSVALFALMDSAFQGADDQTILAGILEYIRAVGTFGIFAIFFGIYYYSGVAKPWYWYMVPAVIIYIIMSTVLWFVYATVFTEILSVGNTDALPTDAGFLETFISFFIGVGLKEEIVKATPVLLALLLAMRLGAAANKPAPTLRQIFGGKASVADILSALALKGPIDGLIMGVAAGGAFTFVETLFGSSILRNYLSDQVARVQGNEVLGLLTGFMLMIPRVLGEVAGHIAWAGTFGYFIGLTAKYRTHWMKLIPIGWVTVAVIHALWDTNGSGKLPYPTAVETVLTIVSVLLFVACLLKGKQLDLVWSGRSADSDSILVGTPPMAAYNPAAAASPAAATAASSPVGGFLAGLQGLASGLEAAAGVVVNPAAAPPPQPTPTIAAPQAAAATAAPASSAERFSIGTGSTRFALEAGRIIDFGALFGANGAPAGATGEISHHPSDPRILGLKNTGAAAWTSTTGDGATISVPPGKNLKIAAGTRLLFGALVLDIQTY